jgi:hypothetical protein
MVEWECPTKPREASGLDPEAVHEMRLYYAAFDDDEVQRITDAMS